MINSIKSLISSCRGAVSAIPSSLAIEKHLKRHRVDPVARMMGAFLTGYDAGFTTRAESLPHYLMQLSPIERGAVFEGLFMALTSHDFQNDSEKPPSALQIFEHFPEQVITFHQGMGASMAHFGMVPVPDDQTENQIWWLQTITSFGLHKGLFDSERTISRQRIPDGITSLSLSNFDQGVGYSIWILAGARAGKIKDIVELFPESRKRELWFAIGLTSSYWGLPSNTEMRKLLAAAGKHRLSVQSGVSMGLWTRAGEGHVPDFTAAASQTICKTSQNELLPVVQSSYDSSIGKGMNISAIMRWRNELETQLLSC